MDYKNMLATVAYIRKKTGKSRVWLFFDIISCGIKYGAGYKDYKLCEFYNLTAAQRATYVTRGINNTIVSMLNDKSYYRCVEDKTEFNTLFADYIHRQWIPLQDASFEDFTAFLGDKSVIIAKPSTATCGGGVEKLRVKDFNSPRESYEHLKQTGAGLAEDFIVQHSKVSAIYPDSVNTYRIVTVLYNGQANVVYAFIRIGNGGRFVDNINNGGMAAPVNVQTGVIEYPAFDKDSVYYDVHPQTGCKIAGYQLPFWRESVDMCLKAAHVVPQLGYVGWDIAVTQDGPLLVEGNHFPGHDILQMPPHVPDKIGMLPRFKQFIPGL